MRTILGVNRPSEIDNESFSWELDLKVPVIPMYYEVVTIHWS